MGEALPNRQSIRRKGWDYTSAGCYFVTINARRNRSLFGAVVNGRMVLNDVGKIAEEEWLRSASLRSEVELDEFVVMPNHVHGVVWLRKGFDASNPCASSPCRPQFGKPVAGALGTIVGAYKAAVTREIRRRGLMPRAQEPVAAGASPIWHRNYWDVIVPDEKALEEIRKYIRFNPRNFDAVMNVGEPQFVGNRDLMKLLKTGFLASRGANTSHGRLPVKSGEAVMSGFLSPMERAVFQAGLERGRPLIWVKPWGQEEGLARQTRVAIEDGKLLIVSPFDEEIDAPSVRRAAWCNQYVLEHCDRMVVGHLNPGGMLACILSECDPEKEIVYL